MCGFCNWFSIYQTEPLCRLIYVFFTWINSGSWNVHDRTQSFSILYADFQSQALITWPHLKSLYYIQIQRLKVTTLTHKTIISAEHCELAIHSYNSFFKILKWYNTFQKKSLQPYVYVHITRENVTEWHNWLVDSTSYWDGTRKTRKWRRTENADRGSKRTETLQFYLVNKNVFIFISPQSAFSVLFHLSCACHLSAMLNLLTSSMSHFLLLFWSKNVFVRTDFLTQNKA